MSNWTDAELIEVSEKFRAAYDPDEFYFSEIVDDVVETVMVHYKAAKDLGLAFDGPPKITGDKVRDELAYCCYFFELYNALSHTVRGDFKTYVGLQAAFALKDYEPLSERFKEK